MGGTDDDTEAELGGDLLDLSALESPMTGELEGVGTVDLYSWNVPDSTSSGSETSPCFVLAGSAGGAAAADLAAA